MDITWSVKRFVDFYIVTCFISFQRRENLEYKITPLCLLFPYVIILYINTHGTSSTTTVLFFISYLQHIYHGDIHIHHHYPSYLKLIN